MVYLWRAVDAEGEVLDVLVQSTRNKHAALKLMRKLLKKYAFVPSDWSPTICDHTAPRSKTLESSAPERGRWRTIKRKFASADATAGAQNAAVWKSPGSAQKFLSTHAAVYNTFNVQRHLTSAQTHRTLRAAAMDTWRTAVAAA